MSSMVIGIAHGWVLVGQVDAVYASRIELIQAAVIRVWGTTQGIGELVTGPTKDTVIDPIQAQVTISRRYVLFTLAATGWVWPEAPGKKKVSSRLAVLPHGWVLVGSVTDDMAEPEGDTHFERAKVVRKWGTTRGLGELITGPTPRTELRPIPTEATIPEGTCLFTFPVEGWEKTLRP